MPQINVSNQEPRSQPYQVNVGPELLSNAKITEQSCALIHPSDLPDQFVQQVQHNLKPQLTIAVPPRDDCKTLEVFSGVLSQLAQAGLTRSSAVIGLGGGAATDLAGYVAASYLRGVAFYTMPTTLLGMVDAAVGGKTGVNLPEGKNLVGAFWPPKAVWCDTNTLATLPDSVFKEGAAEAFKHGLIHNPSLLERVLSPQFCADGELLEETLTDAIAVKAEIVSRDLTEKGERAHLNFGHTLAHALEAVTGQAMPHGQAVGYGMHYAAHLSHALGGADLTHHTAAFLAWQQPMPLPQLTFEEVMPFMARDKKADAEGVRFVLLHDVAKPYLSHVAENVLKETFEQWYAQLSMT